jgi:hypothetical protein
MPESAEVNSALRPDQAPPYSHCRCGHPAAWHAHAAERFCVVPGCGCFNFTPPTETREHPTQADASSHPSKRDGHLHK